jgi:hypothetical protein
MKIIKATKGYEVIVDDSDYDWLSKFRWFSNVDPKGYVSIRANNKGALLYMARMILGVSDKNLCVDHINRNSLDNRRCNLRICTRKQNTQNVKLNRTNTSGYRGVNFYKQNRKWVAKISIDGRRKSIGYYSTPEDAARAYDNICLKERGEFAVLNFGRG